MQHNRHVNSVQWEQALGYARQACASIFRDGGTPGAALGAFGLNGDPSAGLSGAGETADWSIAVDRIARALCSAPQRKAA